MSAERKNYKRIRLAKHLERVLSEHHGEAVKVDPADFDIPLGAWRTNWMLDVMRWHCGYSLVRLPRVTGTAGSYDTLTECAANGVSVMPRAPGGAEWHPEISALPPKVPEGVKR